MFDATVYRLTEHVYWMKPGEPDRPSLGAVVGDKLTLMLDAGASDEHAQLFLDGLAAHGVGPPNSVVLTHWHWDHVFGAARIGAPVIANRMTAIRLADMREQAWDDASLDARVASSEEIAFCADNIKLELPQPRTVSIAKPEIIFADGLDIDLGGISVRVQHVGGDHSADACVIHVPDDRVLFLGDCLYDDIYAPTRHYTAAKALPLINRLLQFDAEIYIEGHNSDPLSRAEFESVTSKMRRAADLVNQHGSEAPAIAKTLSKPLDEETADLVQAFAAGSLHSKSGGRGQTLN